jgi:hypothetical protein
VSLQKIRQALVTANSEYKIEHLLARRDHRTVLIGRDIHIFLQDDPNSPVQLTGKHKGQKSFKECIEMYMQDFDFDAAGLAKIYTAFRFKDEEVILKFHMFWIFMIQEPMIALGSSHCGKTKRLSL